MGGLLNVVIRKSDGEVYSLEGGTNYMPYFLTNMDFFNCSEEHVNNYIKAIKTHIPLAPDDYGMILLDYQTKTLLSSQVYCSTPNKVDILGLLNTIDKRQALKGKIVLRTEKEVFTNHKKIWDSGRMIAYLQGYTEDKFENIEWTDVPIDKNQFSTYEEFLCDLIKKEEKGYKFISNPFKKGKYFASEIIIDVSPWSIFDFGEEREDKPAILNLFNKIVDLGFKLKSEDLKVWENFLERKYDTKNGEIKPECYERSFTAMLRKKKIESI